MATFNKQELRGINTFPKLRHYLDEKLGWPIVSGHFDEMSFDYTPEELGIQKELAAKIKTIKQMRPDTTQQPWGIFFLEFNPKRLPVVVLRRILSGLVKKERNSSSKHKAWMANDLLFISCFGEKEQRQICFVHFSEHPEKEHLPTLKVLGWSGEDTGLHLYKITDTLEKRLSWPKDNGKDVESWRKDWSEAFSLEHRQAIKNASELARRLAVLARSIRDRMKDILSAETKNGPFQKLMSNFQKVFMDDIDEAGFADVYAQTITYGLLSQRIINPTAEEDEGIAAAVSASNPFLQELLSHFLSTGKRKRKNKIDFDELGISEVVELLKRANMEDILRDFGDKMREDDPVVHFYEIFLKEYDAKQKDGAGRVLYAAASSLVYRACR